MDKIVCHTLVIGSLLPILRDGIFVDDDHASLTFVAPQEVVDAE
jgi:hypothetical protein